MNLEKSGMQRVIYTHEYNYKVENSPKAGKVFAKPQRHPFEHHFDNKYQTEHEVCPVKHTFQGNIGVQMNILEAQSYTAGKDQHQHKPFESGSIDYGQHGGSHKCPTSAPLCL